MADGYWRYAADSRYLPAIAPPAAAPAAASFKRPRSEYPVAPAGQEILRYYPRDEERTAHHYLRNETTSFGLSDPTRLLPGGIAGRAVDDPHLIGVGGGIDGRTSGYNSQKPEPALPSDASNTLFVEGLPANCTRREVSHIFRPFVGFREVRLVNKESRRAEGDTFVLCFVDFTTAGQAAVALEALQGYKFDERERDSANLRLQFARFPGRRSGGPRDRR